MPNDLSKADLSDCVSCLPLRLDNFTRSLPSRCAPRSTYAEWRISSARDARNHQLLTEYERIVSAHIVHDVEQLWLPRTSSLR